MKKARCDERYEKVLGEINELKFKMSQIEPTLKKLREDVNTLNERTSSQIVLGGDKRWK